MIDLNNEIEVENFPARKKLPPSLSGPEAYAPFDMDEPDADEGSKAPKRNAKSKKTPVSRKLPNGFVKTEAGLFHKTTEDVDGDTVERLQFLCGNIDLQSLGRNEEGSEWVYKVSFNDYAGGNHIILITEGEIGDPKSLRKRLADNGLRVTTDYALLRKLAEYFVSEAHLNRNYFTHVSYPGWHPHNGNPFGAFVTPIEVISSENTDGIFVNIKGNKLYEKSGSLSGWQNTIGKLVEPFDLPCFAICAALSAPLLRIARYEGFFINFIGTSSRGKTTLMKGVASIIGNGEPGHAITQWNATNNAMERLAQRANDSVLLMDEMGSAQARSFGEMIYNIISGAPKNRLDRVSSLMDERGFRATVISTSEVTLEAKISEDNGKKAKAGQLVRAADIFIECGTRQQIFDVYRDDEPTELEKHESKDRVEAIHKYAEENYGWVFPAFVEQIIARNISKKQITDLSDDFVASVLPDGSDFQVARMAKRFGIVAVAGELAIQFGILPWDAGRATAATEDAFMRWLYMRGGLGSAEQKQHISRVRDFIHKYEASKFITLDTYGNVDEQSPKVLNEVIGYRQKEGRRIAYFIHADLFQDVCKDLPVSAVAKTLAANGMLRFQVKNRVGGKQTVEYTTRKTIVGKGRLPFYQITSEIFGPSDDEDEVTDG